jgi:hypothetical protein
MSGYDFRATRGLSAFRLRLGVASTVALYAVAGLCHLARAEDPAQASEELRQFLFERAGRAPVSILILGTFHFEGSSDDERSVGDMDMLSARRQAEIDEILGLLEKFKPTRVAVEVSVGDQDTLTEQYRRFVSGDAPPEANEVHQLGFRLAKSCGLGSVDAVDAPGRWLEPIVDLNQYARDNDQRHFLVDPYDAALSAAGQRRDELIRQFSLRDALLFLNHPAQMHSSAAIYLLEKLAVGDSENYPGADGFVSQWYNRNLRIYANVLRLVTSDDARIVVIIGSGHAPILRHLFASSLHFRLVEVSDVLRPDSVSESRAP